MSPDEDAVVSGQLPSGQPATELAGQPLPEGGCAGEAVTTPGGDLGSAEAAQSIDTDSVTQAMVGVWFAVDTELQTTMIDERRGELGQVEADKADRLRAARSALGEG